MDKDEEASGEVTALIRAMTGGDDAATEQLYQLVYLQLKQIARRQMANESSEHTLQPTALVNEAYLRLVRETANWRDRRHFFGVASQAMRRILIDSGRRKRRLKRGGAQVKRRLTDSCIATSDANVDWLDIDQALRELELLSPERAELVRLRFFSGLTLQECAELLEISKSTAERSWRFSRAWLKSRMLENEKEPAIEPC